MEHPESRRLSCAVVGAGGYTGAELVSILVGHPCAELRGVFGSEKRGEGEPQAISSVFPRLRGRCDLPLVPASVEAIRELGADAVFLCTPHQVSHDLAAGLLGVSATADSARRLAPLAVAPVVFDLSAAFRLKDASLYPRHYGFEHAHRGVLEKAVYGIPELFREQLTEAGLVAVAGCYPTSAILALAPLVRAGAIEPGRRPIVDSVSGVSGAGRHATTANLFCEVSLQPYNVFTHRHTPEIGAYAGTPVIFTPHLGCFDRGILSTMHVDLAAGWNGSRITEALRAAYADEPFVRLLPPGEWPSVAAVRHTNVCDIGWAVDEVNHHLVIVSAIDNLVKGAAGQAVQCMNARFGMPEPLGLLPEGSVGARA
jgi:N-acetyl-gamma-glutamyl-phosphate reductase